MRRLAAFALVGITLTGCSTQLEPGFEVIWYRGDPLPTDNEVAVSVSPDLVSIDFLDRGEVYMQLGLGLFPGSELPVIMSFVYLEGERSFGMRSGTVEIERWEVDERGVISGLVQGRLDDNPISGGFGRNVSVAFWYNLSDLDS